MPNLTGQSFGRYHILEQLGEGGMATVYKAYDTRLETDVAVKVIRTENLTIGTMDQALIRFEREAKALARLTHPNIVKVTDYGEYEGIPYLVMEYLPSGTLKKKLGRCTPWQDALRLLLPIAHALDFAHRQGMIHRDVKPSNILITADGQPMLTDFGIAKILDVHENTELTGTGVGIGTPEYMAPEQWTGNSSTKSDQYALGVVLYEILTGRKPYPTDTPAAILLKQVNEPLPSPREFVKELPERVEKLLLKTLAKDPADRYENMADFASAVESALGGINHQDVPISTLGHGVKSLDNLGNGILQEPTILENKVTDDGAKPRDFQGFMENISSALLQNWALTLLVVIIFSIALIMLIAAVVAYW